MHHVAESAWLDADGEVTLEVMSRMHGQLPTFFGCDQVFICPVNRTEMTFYFKIEGKSSHT